MLQQPQSLQQDNYSSFWIPPPPGTLIKLIISPKKKKSKCWQDTLRVPAPQNFPDIRFSFAMPSILIVQDLVKQNY